MSNEELKSANSAKIGIIFSDARSKIALTPIEVSEKTLINLKYIQAIESGDYSNFPSEGFARAYFIKYAKFLSIKCDFPSIYEASTREEERSRCRRCIRRKDRQYGIRSNRCTNC